MFDPLGKQLYSAAEDGRVFEVSSLLRDHPEINVNWAYYYQETALHIASLNGHAEVVKLLLAHPNIQCQLHEQIWKDSLLAWLLPPSDCGSIFVEGSSCGHYT